MMGKNRQGQISHSFSSWDHNSRLGIVAPSLISLQGLFKSPFIMETVHGRTPPLCTIHFQRRLFPWRGQDSITFHKQESRDTMNRNSSESLQGIQSEFRLGVCWKQWRGGVSLVFWHSRYLLIRTKAERRDEWGQLITPKAGPWRTGGHACKRPGRYLKEAAPEVNFSLVTQAHCLMWIPPNLYPNHRIFFI